MVVIAAADRDGRRSRIAASRRNFFYALIAGVLAFVAVPAAAEQIGAVVSIFSDDRFRGVSVSDGRPVGTLDLSYDASNGLYASLAGTLIATGDEGLRALSAAFDVGYAKRLHSGLTVDVGAYHSRYSHYSGLSSGRKFTEAYAGFSGRIVGARISVSPDYFGVPRWTAHGELDAHLDLSRNSSLEGRAGLLVPLSQESYEEDLHTQFDARLGIAQRTGPLTFHAALSGRSGSDEIYRRRGHGRLALVFGVSTTL